jgi:hypothetical protein
LTQDRITAQLTIKYFFICFKSNYFSYTTTSAETDPTEEKTGYLGDSSDACD